MTLDDNVVEGLADDDETDNTSVYLFGTDISKIPCFKDSILTGIYGGFGTGIASFLATSNALRSTHVSVVSFSLISIGYFFVCRANWAKQNFIARQMEGNFLDEVETIKEKKQEKQQQESSSNASL